jgi:hypothetical protein
MQKTSILLAIILSCLIPGLGLLLVNKGLWFALYFILGVIGWLFTFFFGLGLIVLIPLWPIAMIHTIVAVNSNNRMAVPM